MLARLGYVLFFIGFALSLVTMCVHPGPAAGLRTADDYAFVYVFFFAPAGLAAILSYVFSGRTTPARTGAGSALLWGGMALWFFYQQGDNARTFLPPQLAQYVRPANVFDHFDASPAQGMAPPAHSAAVVAGCSLAHPCNKLPPRLVIDGADVQGARMATARGLLGILKSL